MTTYRMLFFRGLRIFLVNILISFSNVLFFRGIIRRARHILKDNIVLSSRVIMTLRANANQSRLASSSILLRARRQIRLALSDNLNRRTNNLLRKDDKRRTINNRKNLNSARRGKNRTDHLRQLTIHANLTVNGTHLGHHVLHVRLTLVRRHVISRINVTNIVSPCLTRRLTRSGLGILVISIGTLNAMNSLSFLSRVVLRDQLTTRLRRVIKTRKALNSALTLLRRVTILSTEARAETMNSSMNTLLDAILKNSGRRILFLLLTTGRANSLTSSNRRLKLTTLRRLFRTKRALNGVLTTNSATNIRNARNRLNAKLASKLNNGSARDLARDRQLNNDRIDTVTTNTRTLANVTNRREASLGTRRTIICLTVLVNNLLARSTISNLNVILIRLANAKRRRNANLKVTRILTRRTTRRALNRQLSSTITVLGIMRVGALVNTTVHLTSGRVLERIRRATNRVAKINNARDNVNRALANALDKNRMFRGIRAFAMINASERLSDLAKNINGRTTRANRLAGLTGETANAKIHRRLSKIMEVRITRRHLNRLVNNLVPNLGRVVMTLLIARRALIMRINSNVRADLNLNGMNLLLLKSENVARQRNRDATNEMLVTLKLSNVRRRQNLDNAIATSTFTRSLARLLLTRLRISLMTRRTIRVQHENNNFTLIRETINRTRVLKGKTIRGRATSNDLRRIECLRAIGNNRTAGLGIIVRASDLTIMNRRNFILITMGLINILLNLHDNLKNILLINVSNRMMKARRRVLNKRNRELAIKKLRRITNDRRRRTHLNLDLNKRKCIRDRLITIRINIRNNAGRKVRLGDTTLCRRQLGNLSARTIRHQDAIRRRKVILSSSLRHVPRLKTRALRRLANKLSITNCTNLRRTLRRGKLRRLGNRLLKRATLVRLRLKTGRSGKATKMIRTLARRILTRTTLLALRRVKRKLRQTIIKTNSKATTTAIICRDVRYLLRRALLVTRSSIKNSRLRRSLRAIITISSTTMRIIRIKNNGATAIRLCRKAGIKKGRQRRIRSRPLKAIAKRTRKLRRLRALRRANALLANNNLRLLFRLHKRNLRISLNR